VQGAAELRRTLKKLSGDLGELKEAHRTVAEKVADRARATAPVRTGRLRDSVRPGATKTKAVVRAGGARVPYAGPIHWGWPKRHIDAQPFLKDAADELAGSVEELYRTAVARIVERYQ
jgi:HK97 gp10 family phage protein